MSVADSEGEAERVERPDDFTYFKICIAEEFRGWVPGHGVPKMSTRDIKSSPDFGKFFFAVVHGGNEDTF